MRFNVFNVITENITKFGVGVRFGYFPKLEISLFS